MPADLFLTTFITITDRIIQLLKRQEELNKAAYTDFIAPVFADLDLIHKDYLDSFRRYGTMLDEDEKKLNEFHPIFDAMASDNALSEHLREKLWMCHQQITGKLRSSDAVEFCFVVACYLDGPGVNPSAEIEKIIEKLGVKFATMAQVRLLYARKYALELKEAREFEQLRKQGGGPQSIRGGYALHLMDICDLPLADKKKKGLAKILLLERLDGLQKRYVAVARQHNYIRMKLLTPR